MAVIIIDLETTGLDTTTAKITEVAAVDLEDPTDQKYFVPQWTTFNTRQDGIGLGVSKYFERGLYSSMLTAEGTNLHYRQLHEALFDNTVAGSNPRFDTNLLARVFRGMGLKPEPWHHRLLDLSAYAAGALGLSPHELLGLAKVCELLGVTNASEHSAMGDAMATRECLVRLAVGAGGRNLEWNQ